MDHSSHQSHKSHMSKSLIDSTKGGAGDPRGVVVKKIPMVNPIVKEVTYTTKGRRTVKGAKPYWNKKGHRNSNSAKLVQGQLNLTDIVRLSAAAADKVTLVTTKKVVHSPIRKMSISEARQIAETNIDLAEQHLDASYDEALILKSKAVRARGLEVLQKFEARKDVNNGTS